MDYSEDLVINPLVDFSEDFVGDFDPNILSLEDFENLLTAAERVSLIIIL
jgi:hypothetical protein